MSNSRETPIEKIIVGVAIAVFSAMLVGQGRWGSPTPTPAPPVTSNPITRIAVTVVGQFEFTVQNKLLRPVEIYVDHKYRGTVNSASELAFSISQYPVFVGFKIVKAPTSNGTSIGDEMEGHWQSVSPGNRLTVSNVIGQTTFFYIVLNNETNHRCEVVVNAGGGSETKTGAILQPNSRQVHFGYYRYYSNSNVTLNCDNGYLYWFGTKPGNTQDTRLEIAPETGRWEATMR